MWCLSPVQAVDAIRGEWNPCRRVSDQRAQQWASEFRRQLFSCHLAHIHMTTPPHLLQPADATDILQTPFNPRALIPHFLCSGKQMIRFRCRGGSGEGTFHQDWNICHHTLTHEGVSLFLALCVLCFFFSFHSDKCALCVDSTSGDIWLTKLRFILSITCRLKCPIKVIDRFLARGTVEGEELCSCARCHSTLWVIVEKSRIGVCEQYIHAGGLHSGRY